MMGIALEKRLQALERNFADGQAKTLSIFIQYISTVNPNAPVTCARRGETMIHRAEQETEREFLDRVLVEIGSSPKVNDVVTIELLSAN